MLFPAILKAIVRSGDLCLVNSIGLTQRYGDGTPPHCTIGRKIGFTNRAVWARHGLSAPIWGYMYDQTVSDLTPVSARFRLTDLAEPRIEPEIVLQIAHSPHPDMDDDELLECIEWVAHGLEIVQSIFPGWVFSPADAVAAQGGPCGAADRRTALNIV